MDLEEYLHHHHGIARLSELEALFPNVRSYCRKRGVHQKQGLLVSPLAEGPDRIAALSGALLTGRYAAARHNLPLIDAPAAIDLAVPHTHGRPPTAARSSGVVVHRERFPLFADPDCPWLASVRTTVNHLVRHESRLGAVAALDHVRHKNLMPLDGIVIPGGGPFLPKVREALRRSRTGVRSPLETVVRLQLEDAGIEVETAVLIDSVGEVDMLVAGWLVVETDGQQHADLSQWHTDRERDLRLMERGYVVVRVTYDHALQERTAPLVRELLDRYPDHPRPLRGDFRSWVRTSVR
ncbi:endonuclease domain-containing protein [Actinomyces mediterranea]|uniref:endonuclease domain-containing protein n=1 Tax=Actinomyces mediterranea TaxID=1871028 RepID=UPI00101AE345|nr:DUF559 domain-containing protein [Actinomyces mediterranea]